MKIVCLLLAGAACVFLNAGCATHAGVNTPVVDVGVGGTVH